MGNIVVKRNTNSIYDYLDNALYYIKFKKETVAFDGYCVDPRNDYQQMMTVKKYFGKTSGNQLMHIIVNYNEYVQDSKKAMDYAYKIVPYYGDRFQVSYAIHKNTTYHNKKLGIVNSFYHLHMVFNSVSYVDGKMFAENNSSYNKFREYVSEVTHDKYMQLIFKSGFE